MADPLARTTRQLTRRWAEDQVHAADRKAGPGDQPRRCPDLLCESLVSALIIRNLEPDATVDLRGAAGRTGGGAAGRGVTAARPPDQM